MSGRLKRYAKYKVEYTQSFFDDLDNLDAGVRR